MIGSISSDAGSSRSSVGSSTLNDAGAWNSNAFGRGWRAGAVAAGCAAVSAAGAAGSAAGAATGVGDDGGAEVTLGGTVAMPESVAAGALGGVAAVAGVVGAVVVAEIIAAGAVAVGCCDVEDGADDGTAVFVAVQFV
ncbi:hypothetical protein QZN06_10630 [Burkholderia multivorans]|nr:hypothetical protein [Burkholderia multivorans]